MPNRPAGCGALVVAVGLVACHPARLGAGRNGGDHPVHVGATLRCPQQQGRLVRRSVDPSDDACRYTGPDASQVILRLLPLAGRDASTALADLESTLRANMAPRVEPSIAPSGHEGADHVVLNLPGVHIEADDAGAHVHALGEDIDARSGGDATIGGSWNGVSNKIHSHQDDVEMRFGFSGTRSVDLMFLEESQHPGPSGDRLVGYVARGPAAGPLVVATVESTVPNSGRRAADLDDLKALVAVNVKP